MKYSQIAAVLLAAAPAAQAILAPNVNGMKIIWSDHFKGCAGCRPSESEWDIALHLNTNNEHQEYTTSSSNLQLSGGETLQLVPWRDASTGQWTSGRVESKETFTPSPGKVTRFAAGLRVGDNAQKQGMWPAFWMLGDAMRHGTEWPMCGELDIFEQVNGDMTGHGTVHCGTPDGGPCSEPMGRSKTVAIPDNDFHTWSLIIDRSANAGYQSETISWLLDGAVYNTLSGSEMDEGTWSTLAHSPLYILLNVAVGGNWPGPPTAQTEDGYGSMLEVQYVAVYESN
jgi:beta-glucanase (GH16 family)